MFDIYASGPLTEDALPSTGVSGRKMDVALLHPAGTSLLPGNLRSMASRQSGLSFWRKLSRSLALSSNAGLCALQFGSDSLDPMTASARHTDARCLWPSL